MPIPMWWKRWNCFTPVPWCAPAWVTPRTPKSPIDWKNRPCRYCGTDRAIPGAFRKLRQYRFDGGDHIRILRFGARTETADDLTVAIDQELFEIPLNIAGVAFGIGGLHEFAIQ